MIKTDNKGFTIIELMVATLVFSIVLLVMTMGIISVGRSFHKGILSSKTQEAVRNITNEVTQAIQLSAGHISNAAPAGGAQGYCIGSQLYSFVLHQETTPTQKSLVVRSQSADCPPTNGGVAANMSMGPGVRDLLGERMRLAKFSVVRDATNPNLYKVTIRIVYGDDQDLENPNAANAECKNEAKSSQFCGSSEIQTTVQRRIKSL